MRRSADACGVPLVIRSAGAVLAAVLHRIVICALFHLAHTRLVGTYTAYITHNGRPGVTHKYHLHSPCVIFEILCSVAIRDTNPLAFFEIEHKIASLGDT